MTGSSTSSRKVLSPSFHMHVFICSVFVYVICVYTRLQVLSKIATNRIQKELVEWQVNPPSGFVHRVTDNLQRWVIEVYGAQGTIYADEKYQVQVDFPENYPMEAPQVIFLHPAPLHPHIYSNGHICLGKYFIRLVVTSHDCKLCVYQYPLHAFKFNSQGLNDQKIMIGMLETVEMVDLQRKQDGGFMMIKFNEI
ncbi:hypothetical protein LXL04_013793 [Taraxacum kok-saghyz]